MATLPPALAVGAQYDSLLQSALTQFFERARLETEAVLSPSSDGRLAIEPSADPAALSIRWFGNRYTLRVPPARPRRARRRALRADLPRPCTGHRGRPACVRGAQSAPRDQGLCRRCAGLQLQPRLSSEQAKADGLAEGARTTAALAASRFGPVLKVSEDGLITFYDGGRVWDL
jgi:hypothetical protein